jgi:hypothetical protein
MLFGGGDGLPNPLTPCRSFLPQGDEYLQLFIRVTDKHSLVLDYQIGRAFLSGRIPA